MVAAARSPECGSGVSSGDSVGIRGMGMVWTITFDEFAHGSRAAFRLLVHLTTADAHNDLGGLHGLNVETMKRHVPIPNVG